MLRQTGARQLNPVNHCRSKGHLTPGRWYFAVKTTVVTITSGLPGGSGVIFFRFVVLVGVIEVKASMSLTALKSSQETHPDENQRNKKRLKPKIN
jgi:hypothetical protein